ncbi:MAG TPA: hypothetical protein VMN57_17020 [Anaerolineales bacterium]|nr:hypothetical protein [Anaerolineales bacterium]
MKRVRNLLPVLGLCLAASACGGSEPVTLAEIVVYPEAVPIDGENIVAESVAESIRAGAGDEAVDVEIRMYTVPNDTLWEDVKLFYATETGSADWDASGELTSETDFVSTIGWTRGGQMRPQAFVVAFSPDPLGGPPFLILMLVSE